jgi:hypothetical protein
LEQRSYWKTGIQQKMNREQKPERSVATGLNQGSKAGKQNPFTFLETNTDAVSTGCKEFC